MATPWREIEFKFSEGERVRIQQGAVAELKHIALGGKLELRAVFPDGEFLLDTLGPEKRTRSSSTPRAKR